MLQWIACALSFFFILLASFSQAKALVHSESFVRVRIKSLPAKFKLTGENIQFIGIERKFRSVSLKENQSVQVEIQRVLVAGKSYWQVSHNNLPTSRTLLSSQPALMIQGQELQQGATTLPDKIFFRENLSGSVDLIGVLPLEEYVFSVLTSEMPLGWPIETLKAQAVAIRSYTQAVINGRQSRPYDVESSVLDQVYKKPQGINQAYLAKARQAQRETEGITLLNSKGQTLKAFYHSDCGGKTVLPSSVWNQEREHDVGTSVDSFCASNPRGRWSLTMTKQKLQDLLKSFVGDIRSNDFRKLVGFMDLKSTQFEVFENQGQIQFVGQGFGHGAGLCQWGSKYLGQKGLSYQRILKHYYPLAVLKRDSL